MNVDRLGLHIKINHVDENWNFTICLACAFILVFQLTFDRQRHYKFIYDSGALNWLSEQRRNRM